MDTSCSGYVGGGSARAGLQPVSALHDPDTFRADQYIRRAYCCLSVRWSYPLFGDDFLRRSDVFPAQLPQRQDGRRRRRRAVRNAVVQPIGEAPKPAATNNNGATRAPLCVGLIAAQAGENSDSRSSRLTDQCPIMWRTRAISTSENSSSALAKSSAMAQVSTCLRRSSISSRK